MRAALTLLALGAPSLVFAQTREPPQLDPPRPGQQRPPQPTQPAQPIVSMEDLVRQGYEVRAMQQYGGQAGQFIVLLQRSGEIRSCLMRVERRDGQTPARRTVCF